MIVGVLSDTHGQARRAARAVELLDRLGAAAFIHCGDIGSADVLDVLVGRRAWAVWGNTDDAEPGVEQYAERLGITLARRTPLRIALAGCELLVFHGHESEFARLLAQAQTEGSAGARAERYVLHGHTHQARDVQVGPLRVVNPGALYRATPHTVATIELPAGEVRFWVVQDNGAGGLEEFRAGDRR